MARKILKELAWVEDVWAGGGSFLMLMILIVGRFIDKLVHIWWLRCNPCWPFPGLFDISAAIVEDPVAILHRLEMSCGPRVPRCVRSATAKPLFS